MLVLEGVDEILRRLASLPTTNTHVQRLALRVVDVLFENGFHGNQISS